MQVHDVQIVLEPSRFAKPASIQLLKSTRKSVQFVSEVLFQRICSGLFDSSGGFLDQSELAKRNSITFV